MAFEFDDFAGTVAPAAPRPGRRTRVFGSVVRPTQVKPEHQACAVCGELLAAEATFCPACSATEQVGVWDELPAEAQARLLRRIEASLASDASFLWSPDEPRPMSRSDRTRARYTRLAAQRKLLRDRLLQPLNPEDREFYSAVLARVEAALARAASALG